MSRLTPGTGWSCTWSPTVPGTNVQIWWDGRSVYAGTVSISATTLDTVQLGSEHDQQMADIYIDDVIVNSGTGTPAPVPGPLPEPKGDPSQRFDDFHGDGQSGLLAAGTVTSRTVTSRTLASRTGRPASAGMLA